MNYTSPPTTLQLVPSAQGAHELVVPCAGFESGSVQLSVDSAHAGSWVVSVQQSNDGITPSDFASAVTFVAATFTATVAAAMTAKLDVIGIGYLHVVVTTGGTAGVVVATVSLRGDK